MGATEKAQEGGICVLDEILHLSEPQFVHLSKGYNSTNFTGFL